MSDRINYMDVAKGIGILLVAMGHNDLAAVLPFMKKLIFSFHMPLFFFLSGYFFNATLPFWIFVKKRFDGLLKPFFFTIFMLYFLSISFDKTSLPTAITRIVKSMYGTGNYLDWIQLWFLPHLFVVSIYAYLFYKIVGRINSRWLRWAILLITLFTATLYLKAFFPFSLTLFGKSYNLFGLPYSLDIVMLSGFFFISGSESRVFHLDSIYSDVTFLFFMGVTLVLMNIYLPQIIDLNNRVYDSFLVNTLEAMTGILFVVALARQIDLHTVWFSKLFQYLGRLSLIILILHGSIQDFWGRKILSVIGDPILSYGLGFIMGIAASVLVFELFVRFNQVTSFWLGREAESPRSKAERINDPSDFG